MPLIERLETGSEGLGTGSLRLQTGSEGFLIGSQGLHGSRHVPGGQEVETGS